MSDCLFHKVYPENDCYPYMVMVGDEDYGTHQSILFYCKWCANIIEIDDETAEDVFCADNVFDKLKNYLLSIGDDDV